MYVDGGGQENFKTAPPGKIFGFLGPNGAGKSTTIARFVGSMLPTSGQGMVADWDIVRQAEQINTISATCPKDFSLYEDLTAAGDILSFFRGGYTAQKKPPAAASEEVLQQVGLWERRGQYDPNPGLGF